MIQLGKRQPHERSHFLKLVPKLVPHVLEFVADDRMAFCDLSHVAPKGFCYDTEVTFDFFKLIRCHLPLHGHGFLLGIHSCDFYSPIRFEKQ